MTDRSSNRRFRRVVAAAGAVTTTLALLMPGAHGAALPSPDRVGAFGQPFVEPTIDGKPSKKKCIKNAHKTLDCKPTAGSMAILPNGKILYWNALEGTENVKNGIDVDFGTVSINDQTRVLDLSPLRWLRPKHND